MLHETLIAITKTTGGQFVAQNSYEIPGFWNNWFEVRLNLRKIGTDKCTATGGFQFSKIISRYFFQGGFFYWLILNEYSDLKK